MSSSPSLHDVVVIGAGPAGLAASAALSERGLDVVTVAPERGAWPNNYGLWLDEAARLEITGCLAARWSRPLVWLDAAAPPRCLPRVYCKLDNEALRRRLMTRAAAGSWSRCRARVRSAVVEADSHRLTLDDGAALGARLVIDASGHRPCLVRRGVSDRAAAQVAYGAVIEVARLPMALDEMWLMDYRPLPGAAQTPPTFLYAMPLDARRLFVEETALASRPPLTMDALRARWRARLDALGLRPLRVSDEERCVIPMDPALPPLDQPIVGFGAAASMAHPATGYMLPRVLEAASDLAEAAADALRDPTASPGARAARCWQALWPAWRQRQRQLYLYGLETLLGMDGPTLRAHFGAFFDLPLARWQGYHAGSDPAHVLARTMWTLFSRAPAALRWRLLRAAPGAARRLVARADP